MPPTIAAATDPQTKPRLLVLTDIGGDPDDQQSMIRLLVHSNEFELEGLVASASGTPNELKERVTKPQLIREQIEAYAIVFSNLKKHAAGFPSPDSLLEIVKSGNPNRGRDFIGEGHDTEGSRWIIACTDKADPRPLNITIWGGQTDLAQALWRVRKDRGNSGFQDFQSRIRVFDIDDQDKIHDWLFAEFPDVFYVLSKAPLGTDKREGAYRGMYLGGDQSLTSLAWLDEHVRKNHGPLGALYPSKTWTAPNPNSALKEGDTPSWFFFYPNGLSDPAHPEWGGWGGRYVHEKDGLFRDAKDSVNKVTEARATVWRWRDAFQNSFAARMDWCVADNFAKANHPPLAVLATDRSTSILEWSVKSGNTVTLSSVGSSDPDGNDIRTDWFVYREAGTCQEQVALESRGEHVAIFTAPQVSQPATVHVVLKVTDDGQPPLTGYRRAVIEVQP
ncbi:MAG: DUF1593 domain-containing protein [Planctomycetaceae bacterium]|nr:DUF1593 domain-containing protein [Planctomycetaceae bacterium]